MQGRVSGLPPDRPPASDTRPLLLPLALFGAAELLFDVNLQVRLGDLREGHAGAPRSPVVEQNPLALDRQDAPVEVALTIDGPARLQPRQPPGEALVVPAAVESAFQPRRGDFQRVSAGDEVFNVEDCTDVLAQLRAVFVGDAARLVNEDAHYRRARPPGHLHVDEFEAALACGALGDPAHARLD